MTEGEIGWSGLLVSARRWGALAWSEARLSEVLAARIGGTGDPATVVELAGQARRHAARATVVRERLPELRELPLAQLVGPGGDEWADAVDALVSGSEPAGGLADYAGRVLPALVASYRLCAAGASPVAEPSVKHHLARLADEAEADRRRWAGTLPDPSGPPFGPVEVLGLPPV